MSSVAAEADRPPRTRTGRVVRFVAEAWTGILVLGVAAGGAVAVAGAARAGRTDDAALTAGIALAAFLGAWWTWRRARARSGL